MANILIIVGSVYGGAQFVAEQVQDLFIAKGHQVWLKDDPNVSDLKTLDNDVILAICSTTGQGDLPDNLVGFYQDCLAQMPLIANKRYGVIALGDSSYGDTYCGGGKLLDDLFQQLQAVKVGESLQIDACEVLQPEDAALPWVAQWLTQL